MHSSVLGRGLPVSVRKDEFESKQADSHKDAPWKRKATSKWTQGDGGGGRSAAAAAVCVSISPPQVPLQRRRCAKVEGVKYAVALATRHSSVRPWPLPRTTRDFTNKGRHALWKIISSSSTTFEGKIKDKIKEGKVRNEKIRGIRRRRWQQRNPT